MLEYLELCKWAETGPSGPISMCDRLSNALTFVRLQKTAPDALRKQEEIRTTIEDKPTEEAFEVGEEEGESDADG